MSGIYHAFVSDIATAIARQLRADRHTPMHNVAIQAVSATPPAERFVLDAEKMVWHYPGTLDRVIEDLP